MEVISISSSFLIEFWIFILFVTSSPWLSAGNGHLFTSSSFLFSGSLGFISFKPSSDIKSFSWIESLREGYSIFFSWHNCFSLSIFISSENAFGLNFSNNSSSFFDSSGLLSGLILHLFPYFLDIFSLNDFNSSILNRLEVNVIIMKLFFISDGHSLSDVKSHFSLIFSIIDINKSYASISSSSCKIYLTFVLAVIIRSFFNKSATSFFSCSILGFIASLFWVHFSLDFSSKFLSSWGVIGSSFGFFALDELNPIYFFLFLVA